MKQPPGGVRSGHTAGEKLLWLGIRDLGPCYLFGTSFMSH